MSAVLAIPGTETKSNWPCNQKVRMLKTLVTRDVIHMASGAASWILPNFQRLLSPMGAAVLLLTRAGKAGHQNNSLICCRRTGELWQRWNTAPEYCFNPSPKPHGNKTQQTRRKGSRGSDSNGWDLGSTWTALSSGYCSLQTGDGWLYISWPQATSNV